jgi:phosphoribosylglycinamide formyltransferase-1
MTAALVPIAVFLSGGGRTLENLLQHKKSHGLPIDVQLVISSRPDVRGVEIGKAAGIESHVIKKSKYPTAEAYTRAMFDPCRQRGAQWVVMAGFLKHVVIPDDYMGRVINIHPSLLPAFGGQGMYGERVHQAAISRGVKFSGCTVHLVDNQYDHGPIVLQRICEVLPDDTPSTLAARVFELECQALPDAIRELIDRERTRPTLA